MRFAIAGLWHETNTFSPVAADLAAFEADALLRGGDVLDEYRGSGATIAGFMDAAAECGFEIVPLLHARTGPIGLITTHAFDTIVDEIVAELHSKGPWDGVLLANHGAAVCASHLDADGEIVRRVRAAIGADVPLGVALDLHANLSPRLVDDASVVTVYQTNPHLDARERGADCARLIWQCASGQIQPVMALRTPPLVINITRQATAAFPMSEVLEAAQCAARQPGMLSTSAVQGYPYADVPEMGMSFLSVVDGDARLAHDAATRMAVAAWSLRDEMRADIPSVTEALRAANVGREAAAGPILVMDVGDNILGGSSADSTVILAEARRLGISGILQSLYDPSAVAACMDVGAGGRVSLVVGAHTDSLHGIPLPVSGEVQWLGDGRYEDLGPTHGGNRYFDDGRRAVLRTDDGNTLLLTSLRSSNLSREQMYSAGIRPENFAIVVAKGVVSPLAAYEPIACKIVLADSPGLTSANLDTFRYQHRRRPLFPFESTASFES